MSGGRAKKRGRAGAQPARRPDSAPEKDQSGSAPGASGGAPINGNGKGAAAAPDKKPADKPLGAKGGGDKGNGGKSAGDRGAGEKGNGWKASGKKPDDKDKGGKGAKGEKSGKKPEEPVSGWMTAWEYGKALLLAVILALIIRSFVVQAFHIPSGSMIPTFLEGDRVLVSKFSYGVRNPFNNKVIFGTGSPRRWDVVIFKYPSSPDMDFVKRVVALPGETVEVRSGEVLINGEKTPDPHGRYIGSSATPSRNFGPVTVPDHQYFMMGDNRDFSNDSRGWGFVDSSLLRGKAWRLYWSWDSDGEMPFWKRLRLSRLGLKIN